MNYRRFKFFKICRGDLYLFEVVEGGDDGGVDLRGELFVGRSGDFDGGFFGS